MLVSDGNEGRRDSEARRPPETGGSARLVRILLRGELQRALQRLVEVALLDRLGPAHDLLETRHVRLLVHRLDDRPVPDLAGLGHRQELEAVERVGVATEVGRHHLRRLLFRLAPLLHDPRLLAADRAGDLRAPLLRLLRLLTHALERLAELRVLDELADALRRALRRHREAGHLAELAL